MADDFPVELTVAEAAELMHTSKRTAYRHIRNLEEQSGETILRQSKLVRNRIVVDRFALLRAMG